MQQFIEMANKKTLKWLAKVNFVGRTVTGLSVAQLMVKRCSVFLFTNLSQQIAEYSHFC